MKFFVCLYQYVKFDKIWSSDTETANQTEPQYSQSETGLEPVQFIAHSSSKMELTPTLMDMRKLFSTTFLANWRYRNGSFENILSVDLWEN